MRQFWPIDTTASVDADALDRKSWGVDDEAEFSAGKIVALDQTERRAMIDAKTEMPSIRQCALFGLSHNVVLLI